MRTHRVAHVPVPAHIARYVARLLADRERLLARQGVTVHEDQIAVRQFLAAAAHLPDGDAAHHHTGEDSRCEWIATAEAAALIGCTSRTVRRWVENGWIEGRRVGRGLIVSRTEVESVAERGRP